MRAKRVPGMLCRSQVATAVCVPGERSVAAPRRQERSTLAELADLKYSRLAESRRLRAGGRSRAVTVPMVTKKEKKEKKEKSPPRPASGEDTALPPPPADQVFQVVVMKVSIHCQGCAGKVKKHISKMQGVTSFSIDLETKRVTVMGNVSPDGVLESISKVKKAEFWTC